ncbi:hypothetical protein [Streptomyces sp. NPDC053079]|uniref:hypothetical protein n=1 Tax=Streptomyces sp. NPDC053079 TaxID=3365697 RepID=UPI0037D27318
MNQGNSTDPIRAVLAAIPDKLLRACGGVIPRSAMEMIHDELSYRTTRQITARIERRWWNSWASRPLQRATDEKQEGYGPDDVVLWLLAPTPCSARCEDGFSADNPDWPCPACKDSTHAAVDEAEPDPAPATDRTPAEAIAYRPPMAECVGKGGTCGVPVAPPHTQCPSCLGWPRCACGRPYDPDHGEGCRLCRAVCS